MSNKQPSWRRRFQHPRESSQPESGREGSGSPVFLGTLPESSASEEPEDVVLPTLSPLSAGSTVPYPNPTGPFVPPEDWVDDPIALRSFEEVYRILHPFRKPEPGPDDPLPSIEVDESTRSEPRAASSSDNGSRFGERLIASMRRDRESSSANPPSPRDWHSPSVPIRREHFNEYVEVQQKEMEALRTQSFNLHASFKQNDIERRKAMQDRDKWKRHLELYRKVLNDKGGVAAQIAHLEFDYAEHRWNTWVEGDGMIQRQKTWVPEDFARAFDSPPEVVQSRTWKMSDHRDKGKFLRDDVFGQTNELRTEIKIVRAKILALRNDFGQMESVLSEASVDAAPLTYQPLFSKLAFYGAMAKLGMQDFDNASRLLNIADGCKGYYREGELVDEFRRRLKLKKDVEEGPSRRNTAEQKPGEKKQGNRTSKVWQSVKEAVFGLDAEDGHSPTQSELEAAFGAGDRSRIASLVGVQTPGGVKSRLTSLAEVHSPQDVDIHDRLHTALSDLQKPDGQQGRTSSRVHYKEI